MVWISYVKNNSLKEHVSVFVICLMDQEGRVLNCNGSYCLVLLNGSARELVMLSIYFCKSLAQNSMF